jgi:hypothetical protein
MKVVDLVLVVAVGFVSAATVSLELIVERDIIDPDGFSAPGLTGRFACLTD